MKLRSNLSLSALLLGSILLASCGNNTPTTPTPTTSSIALTCPAATLVSGSAFTCTATAKDASGNVLSTQPTISYTSSNTGVATVDASGKVTAVAPGTAIITAKVGDVTQTFTVTVSAPTPTSTVKDVSLTCTPTTITTVTYSVCTATAKDASGTALTNQPITYKSSDPSVASVDFSGIVQGLKPGTTTITATAGGVSATQTITVNANQANPLPTVPQQLGSIRLVCDQSAIYDTAALAPDKPNTSTCLATALDTNGQPMTAQPTITLNSSDTSVATVAAGTQTPVGQYYTVTGLKGGQTTLTATAGGKTSAPVVMTVIQTLASVKVTCTPTSIVATGTSTCTATAYDKNNITLTTQPASFTWNSSNTTVASIAKNNPSSTATVTGKTAGTTNITASATDANGFSATSTAAPVTVTPNAVVSVKNSTGATVSGATVTLTPTAGGAPITLSPDATGQYVTSLAPGNYTLNVAAPGYQTVTQTNQAVVAGTAYTNNVTLKVDLGSVIIDCTPTTILAAATSQCTATARDSGGTNLPASLQPAQNSYSWASNNTSVATVDTSGKVTGKSAGTAGITASISLDGSPAVITSPAKTITVNPNVSITVKNTAGAGISADTVQLCPTTGPCITGTATGTPGVYTFSAFPAGNYTLNVTKNNYDAANVTVSKTINVPANATTVTADSVTLAKKVNYTFNFRRPVILGYAPATNVSVTLYSCTASSTNCTTTVDTANTGGGSSYAKQLSEGFYRLVATSGAGTDQYDFTVNSTTSNPQAVTITLQ